jgi:hypothetical protein
MNYNFVAPVFSLTEDNESEITKTLVRFISRGRFPEPSPEDGSGFWDCNVCPNDDKYCQPWIVGDKIYFQISYIPFVLPDTGGTLFDPFFKLIVNGEPLDIPSGLSTQIGTGATDGINYINAMIDTSDPFFANLDCFYFQIAIQSENLATDANGTPIGEPMRSCFLEQKALGATTQEAYDHCAYLHLTDKYNTQFYCLAKCNENTILIEGSYLKETTGRRPAEKFDIVDCSGFFHGLMIVNGSNAFNLFEHKYRVRGSVESVGFEFEEVLTNQTKTSSKQKETFTMFTNKIPFYVVNQIAACFNSRLLTIDSVRYFGGISLQKNFDEGNMWILKENLFIDCDQINYNCT